MLDAPPFGNPQVSLRYPDWPNSSPLRGWSFGAVWGKRERMRARYDRRTSTASGWGLAPPLPPKVPKRGRLLVMRARAWYRVRFGFAGNAFANLPEASAAQRLGVPSNPDFIASFWRANCGRRSRQRDRQGESQRGAQPSLASLCLLSAGQKVGARRGPSASKEKLKIFKRHKKGKETSRQKSPGAATPPKSPRARQGEIENFQKT